jgi:hypothetical protein
MSTTASTTVSDLSTLLAAVVAAHDLPESDTWEATYDTAANAAVAAIVSRLDEIIPTLTVSCTDADHDSPEETGGGLYSNYTTELPVGTHTSIVGGWMVCGWIAAGASADLDGSGLANWGSSQPGGWSCCDSDGACGGNPSVSSDDYGVTVTAGDGRTGDMKITIASLLGLTEAEQTIIEEHLILYRPLAALASEIRSALDEMSRGVSEPSADELWDEMSHDEVVEDRVRVGSFGGYPVVVICNSDGDYTAYITTVDDEWQRDVRRAAADHAEAEVASLLAKMDDQD